MDNNTGKVSPPNKMSKNRRNSESNEVLGKLDSIETKFGAKLDSIEARFANLEKEVAQIAKVLKEIETVKAEVDSLKEAVTGFKRLEMDVKKRCVLVRGLKFQTSDKYESRIQTRAALADFFGKLGMTPHLVDYHRLGGRGEDGDGSKVSVKVEFVNVDQKFELFEKLKSKGRELSAYSVLTDYPSFQQAEFKQLSEKAYNLRRLTPGTKTRIVPKGLGLVLQQRGANADRWTAVSQ